MCVHGVCVGCECIPPHMYNHDNIRFKNRVFVESVRVHEGCICVCPNNGAWWTGAFFDAMRADRRETGPIRFVGDAN